MVDNPPRVAVSPRVPKTYRHGDVQNNDSEILMIEDHIFPAW